MATTMLRITRDDYDRLKTGCNANTTVKHSDWYDDFSRKIEEVVAEKIATGINLSLEMAYLVVFTDYIHMITLRQLSVPDPNDAEIRILVGKDENGNEISATSIEIMYTIGDNEYPDFPGSEKFRPSEVDMIWLWHDIKRLRTENKILGVKEITVNGLENSTFIWRDDEEWSKFCDTTDGGPQEADELKESVDLIIYMTEEMRNALKKRGGGSPELSRSIEEEYPLVGDFAKAVRERLGIKESGVENERKLNCRIVVPDFADVGVGVEVKTADTLSRARQQELAEALKNALEDNEVTKDPNVGVEVWIKPGKEVLQVKSEVTN